MEDQISKFEQLHRRFKKNPKKTIVYAIIVILVCIVVWFTAAFIQEKGRQFASPKQKQKIQLNDVFEEVDKLKKVTDTAVATRTFSLLREEGASITLGPCPSLQCFNIELGKLHKQNGKLFQKFILTGDGFSFFKKTVDKQIGDHVERQLISGIDDDFVVKNTEGIVLFSPFSSKKEITLDIALAKGAEVTAITRAYDIKFIVVDINVDSLKIRMEVSPSSGRDDSGIDVTSTAPTD